MLAADNHRQTSRLQYLLVLAAKDGEPTIDATLSEKLKKIFERRRELYDTTLDKWEYGDGYVKALFTADIETPLLDFIKAYKVASRHECKFGENFCLLTVGDKEPDVTKDFIAELKAVKTEKTAEYKSEPQKYKKRRCRDCIFLVDGDAGTWRCGRNGKDIHGIADSECPYA